MPPISISTAREPSARKRRPPQRDDELGLETRKRSCLRPDPVHEDVPLEVSEESEDGDNDDEGPEAAKETPEQEMKRLQQHWTARVYQFFQKDPIVTVVNGRPCHEFICNAKICKGEGHENKRRVRRFLDKKDAKSTGGLRKHAIRCFGEKKVSGEDSDGEEGNEREQDGTITSAFERTGAGKVTYSNRNPTPSEIRAEAVRWVSENKRPFSIISDRGFLKLMKTGRPFIVIPSPITVSRDVKLVFIQVRRQIADILKAYPGYLSFATDAWTSPNNKPYMAITVHLEQRGKPVSLLLDLVEVAKSHTGVNLAAEFARVIKEFGIEKKMLAITCDNASNNDTMLAELSCLITTFRGGDAQSRCLAHILNLVLKSVLRPVGGKKNAQVEQQVEDDIDGDNIEGWEAGTESDDDDEASIEPVRNMLIKLRKCAYAIRRSSTILLPKWYQILENQGLSKKIMPRDVSTRWNSTYDMICFAVEYKSALKSISSDMDELADYSLNSTEWKAADELGQALKIFKDATQFASRNGTSVASVIPAMDHIHSMISAQSIRHQFSPAILSALRAGLSTLERYYDKAHTSELHRIAIILHPRYKAQYFSQVGADEGWIKEAKEIVRIQWEADYCNKNDAQLLSSVSGLQRSTVTATAEPANSPMNIKHANIFDSDFLDNDVGANGNDDSDLDELSRYLATEPDRSKMAKSNPIGWWKERAHVYPTLSRMAVDYLNIPASSVAVERVFSQGRLVLSHVRNRLDTQSTRALMCLGEWSTKGFVKDKDVLDVTKQAAIEEDEDEEDVDEGWDMISA